MSEVDPTRDRKFRTWYPKSLAAGIGSDTVREAVHEAWNKAWEAKPSEPREQTTWCALCLMGACQQSEGHIKAGHRKEAATVYYGDALCEHCLRHRREQIREHARQREMAAR